MGMSGLTVMMVGATVALLWFSASLYASVSSAIASQPENWEISIETRGTTRVTQVIHGPGNSNPVRHVFTRSFGSDEWSVKSDSGAIYSRKPLSSTDPLIQETSDATLDGTAEIRAKWIGPGQPPSEVILELSPARRYREASSSTTLADIEARDQQYFRKTGFGASESLKVVKLPIRNEDAFYEIPFHETHKPESVPNLVTPYLVRIGQRVAGFAEFSETTYGAGRGEQSEQPQENKNLDPRNLSVDVGAVATSETGNPSAVMKYESPSIFPKLYGTWSANRSFELSHPARNNFQFNDSKLSRTYSEAELETMIAGKPDLNVLTMEVRDGSRAGPQTAVLTIRVHAPFEYVSATPFRKVYGPWTRSSGGLVSPPDTPVSIGAVIGREAAEEELKRNPRPEYSIDYNEFAEGIKSPKLGISLDPSPTFPAGFIRAFLKACGSPVKSATPPEVGQSTRVYGPFSFRGVRTPHRVVSVLEARTVTFERSITVREFGRNGFLGLRTIAERRAFSDLYPGTRNENFEVRMSVSLHKESGPTGRTLFYVYEDGSFELAPDNQTPGEQILPIEQRKQ